MTDSWRPNGASDRLNGAEAAELSRQIAGLAQAGLPLANGLVALGEELPRGRLRRSMNALAATLESGATLDQAVQIQKNRIPPHLRGLVIAGLRSGRLGDVLSRFSEYTGVGTELKRRLWLNLAYPVLTVCMAMALFFFVCVILVGQFDAIYRDFGIPLPRITIVLVSIGRVVTQAWAPVAIVIGALVCGWLAAHLLLPVSLRRGLAGRLPLVGPVWRATSIAEFCHLLALLLESQLPLPEAIRLTGEGVQDSSVNGSCQIMARAVESGRSLSDAMAQRPLFPRAFLVSYAGPKTTRACPRCSKWPVRCTSRVRDAFHAGRCYPQCTLRAARHVDGDGCPGTVCAAHHVDQSFVGINRSFREKTVATGPSEPSARQEGYWEEGDITSSVSVPAPADSTEAKSPLEMDLAEYISPQRATPWRLSHMMYLVAGAAVFLWLVVLLYDSILLAFFVLAGIIFAFAMVMGGGVIQARRRSTRQDSLLWVLAIAAEHGMPLYPAVAACAEQYWGPAYARMIGLATRLNEGTMLPEALEQSRGVVSRDAVLLAWVGQESGNLPRALRLAATTRSTQLPIWTAIAARLSYVLGVLLITQTVACFILYFIMPKFEAIFADFNLPLPATTIWVIDGTHVLIKYGYITLVFLLIEVGLLVFLPFSFLAWGNHTIPLLDQAAGPQAYGTCAAVARSHGRGRQANVTCLDDPGEPLSDRMGTP